MAVIGALSDVMYHPEGFRCHLEGLNIIPKAMGSHWRIVSRAVT